MFPQPPILIRRALEEDTLPLAWNTEKPVKVWHPLTYADICWRMLTYEEDTLPLAWNTEKPVKIWHPLTYADYAAPILIRRALVEDALPLA